MIKIITQQHGSLDGLSRGVLRAARNGMNRSITVGKRHTAAEIATGTGLKKKQVRGALASKRAGSRNPAARLVASSRGLPATDYPVRVQRVGYGKNATRGRIVLPWFGREKVAAGFINPLGKKGAPLRTRSHKGKFTRPRPAVGPSVAAAFTAMSKSRVTKVTRDATVENIKADLKKLAAKGLK